MNKKGTWSRGAIDAYLANGGDIKTVDKFLLRGGQIPQPVPKTSGTIGHIGRFGANYYFSGSYSGYIDDSAEERRLSRWTGGVLHDDYSEESFP